MTNSSVEANKFDDNIVLPVVSPITAAVIGALWPASALMAQDNVANDEEVIEVIAVTRAFVRIRSPAQRRWT
jgi:hypothetical protein